MYKIATVIDQEGVISSTPSSTRKTSPSMK